MELEFEELVYEAALDILSNYPNKEERYDVVFEKIKTALDNISEKSYNPTHAMTVEQFLADAGL